MDAGLRMLLRMFVLRGSPSSINDRYAGMPPNTAYPLTLSFGPHPLMNALATL